MDVARPAGPISWNPLKNFVDSKNDSLNFYTNLANDYGDISYFRLGHKLIYFINHPEFIDQVLRVNKSKYQKDFGLSWARNFMGQGILLSEGKMHLANRKAIQPAFDKTHLEYYAAQILECVELITSTWRDNSVVNVEQEMLRLSISVVGKTLFGVNLIEHASKIHWATSTMLEAMVFSLVPCSELIMKMPTKLSKEVRHARAYLFELVDYIIEQHAKRKNAPDNFLSQVFVTKENGEDFFDHKQKRDEAITILLAGHETVSTLMTWTWYCLAKNEATRDMLCEEARKVLVNNHPGINEFKQLKFTTAVVNETLRLYPSIWFMTRLAIADDKIGDYVIPKGSIITMSQYVTHRDKRFFPNPNEFQANRWLEKQDGASKLAFFPFGAGLRKCIGDQLATIEACISLACIAKNWKLKIKESFQPKPSITLRPNRAITAKLKKLS